MRTRKNSAKSNITLKVDKDLLRKVKILAAKRETSISAMLANFIEKMLHEDQDYESAKRRAIARMRDARPLFWKKPASRDELHER